MFCCCFAIPSVIQSLVGGLWRQCVCSLSLRCSSLSRVSTTADVMSSFSCLSSTSVFHATVCPALWGLKMILCWTSYTVLLVQMYGFVMRAQSSRWWSVQNTSVVTRSSLTDFPLQAIHLIKHKWALLPLTDFFQFHRLTHLSPHMTVAPLFIPFSHYLLLRYPILSLCIYPIGF